MSRICGTGISVNNKKYKQHMGLRQALFLPLLAASTLLAGCGQVFDWISERNLDPSVGVVQVRGLQEDVSIRRDDYGVPFIEAQSLQDLTFGIGYAMAEDRLAQMVSMNLLARGRLAEMTGDIALDMDIYMRTLGIPQIIEERYAALSPELKQHLTGFAAGVNAYINSHRDRLPLELTINDYQPEAWQPANTLGLFVMLNLGVGFNLHEELGFLQLAEKLGVEKAAYLAPIYPDESIDVAEANKLAGVDLSGTESSVAALKEQLSYLAAVEQKLKRINGQGIAASNNWGVHKDKTAAGATLVANDTHLLLSHPSTWILMGVKSPEYSGVGITLPGIPALVAGYNGHIGWGETMVMADTQDVFLEKLRERDGKTEYLYQGQWYPVSSRSETIRVKGAEPVTIEVQSTRHGPLLNAAIKGKPKHEMIAIPASSEFGLALSWTAQFPDNTIDSFFNLGKAKTMDEAEQALNGVGFIHLNVIYGDKDNVAWQVTGNYPKRKAGSGHFPSPGWTGEYDWQGYWGGADTPRSRNPQSGYLGTGNNRTVAADYSPRLTSSWYYPERSERIMQMLMQHKGGHDYTSMEAMQADRRDILVAKVQQLWGSEPWQNMIRDGIAALPQAKQADAENALQIIRAFDGDMAEGSRSAAVWGGFEHNLVRAIFMDELGPEDGQLWQAFLAMNGRAYSGYQDHLLGRTQGSNWAPFWDDINSAETELPGQIIARALAATWPYLQQQLGEDDSQWRWGDLAFYHWQTETTHMLPFLSGLKAAAVESLADYTDRGPYPAGGNRNTLNVAGYDLGSDYAVWNIPAMRMIVDFSQPEPLNLIVAGGQSGNPASPHYDDGIQLWLSRKNRNLPFNDAEKVRAHFSHERVLHAE